MADRDEIESRRILERVNAETEARMKARDQADSDDWAEFWGRRMGRILSFVLLAVAVIWIYQFLVGNG